MVVRSLGL